jgi:hypothetical protein
LRLVVGFLLDYTPFTMLQAIGNPFWKELVVSRLPPLAVSLVLTDAYVHLGSFARECVVFLALWYGLDRLYGWVRGIAGRSGGDGEAAR